ITTGIFWLSCPIGITHRLSLIEIFSFITNKIIFIRLSVKNDMVVWIHAKGSMCLRRFSYLKLTELPIQATQETGRRT
ncbi:MAG TPA: hypothetical protein VEI53_12150, partial [Ktedonobacteraceae bacterium]|nr:hypothetical protein [Ktedonobacteraceae bacterium]